MTLILPAVGCKTYEYDDGCSGEDVPEPAHADPAARLAAAPGHGPLQQFRPGGESTAHCSVAPRAAAAGKLFTLQ